MKVSNPVYKALDNLLSKSRDKDFCQNAKRTGGHTKIFRDLRNSLVEQTGVIEEQAIIVKLYDTEVLIAFESGYMILNSGGWLTQTTKKKINRWTEKIGVYISQCNSMFWVTCKNGNSLQSLQFVDGMILNPDGSILSFPGNAIIRTFKEIKNLKKKINQYTKEYIKRFMEGKIPAPGPGDCFFCQMKSLNSDGSISSSDHLWQHIIEKYYVPSMLKNAIETFPVGKVIQDYYHARLYFEKFEGNQKEIAKSILEPDNWYSQVVPDYLKKSLRRFLYRSFGFVA